MPLRAQRVSAQLKKAGHNTWAANPNREGRLVVQQIGDAVRVTTRYDTPQPDMADIVDDVLQTIRWFGYVAKVSQQDERGMSIFVTAPEPQPAYRGHAIDTCSLCDRRTAVEKLRTGVYVFPDHRIERGNVDSPQCEGSRCTPAQALMIKLNQAPKAERRVSV
jgi:hypothetical protein